MKIEPSGDLLHEVDLETDPLPVRDELEWRIDEVGADAEDTRLQCARRLSGASRRHQWNQQGSRSGSPHLLHQVATRWPLIANGIHERVQGSLRLVFGSNMTLISAAISSLLGRPPSQLI
jgi:hypothetical protein